MDNVKLPDMTEIMKIAQQVASQIDPPPELKNGKQLDQKAMNNMIGQITKSVSNIVNVNDPVDEVKKEKVQQSKISMGETSSDSKKTKKKYVEIETASSDNEDPSCLRTPDMSFTVSVTLEELYMGTKKKLAIRRQVIDKDGSYIEEKKKLGVKIEPGMIEEQVIRFNRMADEKQGYETGDVVVNLDVEEHPTFIRDGNNLLIEKEISFSELYKPIVYVKHLDKRWLKVSGEPLNFFSDDDDMLKKITGEGMPIKGEQNKKGDLFIRFKCVDNSKISKDEIFNKLSEIYKVINVSPTEETGQEEFVEKSFELVTDSDLDFLDSEESSDEYSDEYSEEDSD